MSGHQLCRVGVFYDGSYFMLAQRDLFAADNGWLEFRRFHRLVERQIAKQEPGFASTKIVYAAWFQGLHSTTQGDDADRLRDRRYHHDLLHAGIEAKWHPMSVETGCEKGVDVALAVEAMQVAHDDRIDVAVLVTGDGDMVPLAQALMKRGVRVLIAHFEYTLDENRRTWANERLLAASNYVLNINALEANEKTRAVFHGLFRKDAGGGQFATPHGAAQAPPSLPCSGTARPLPVTPLERQANG
jgi:uncharacterized LabA/DUF88 family protein